MSAAHHRWLPVALLATLLVATGLRFWQLAELPPGLYHDEAYNGLDALSLLSGETFPRFYEGWELYAQDAHAERPPVPTKRPVFFEGNFGREPLHVYLMALSIWLAGATPFAIRAVPAAAGVLAVLTTYLAAGALIPPSSRNSWTGILTPLLAALTLAILYPAVHFSRFGIRAMLFVPCATLAVYAFWRGWRAVGKGAWLWLGVAGFFIGLGLYTYAAARLFPLLFVLFFVYMAWQDWPALKQRWQPLLLMIGVAVLTAAPLLYFFARYPYYFFFRIAYVANKGKGTVPDAPFITWLTNVGRVVGGLFWQGETHLRHNLPGRPYLDFLQSGLFLVGAGRTAWHWRRPEAFFLLAWTVVMLLPSILSGDAPHFGRLTGAAPAIAVLVGLGAASTVQWVMERWHPRPLVGALLVSLLFLPSLFLTTRDYFGRYASHPDLARDFQQSDWEMGRLIAAQPQGTASYLAPTQEEMATIYFAIGDPDLLRSFSGEDTLFPGGVPERAALHILRPSELATLDNLRDYFPESEVVATNPDYQALFTAEDSERIVVPALVNHSFGEDISLAGYTSAVGGDVLTVTLVWQALKPGTADYTAYIHLTDDEGNLVAQADRPPQGYPTSEWRDREIVVDTFRVDLPPNLSPGVFRLVTGFYSSPDLVPLGQPAELGTVELGN